MAFENHRFLVGEMFSSIVILVFRGAYLFLQQDAKEAIFQPERHTISANTGRVEKKNNHAKYKVGPYLDVPGS